jgi:hypothetical protein
MTKSERLQKIEASFRRAEEALRRGDPDTLAGRMPKEWQEQEAARLAGKNGKGTPASQSKNGKIKPTK